LPVRSKRRTTQYRNIGPTTTSDANQHCRPKARCDRIAHIFEHGQRLIVKKKNKKLKHMSTAKEAKEKKKRRKSSSSSSSSRKSSSAALKSSKTSKKDDNVENAEKDASSSSLSSSSSSAAKSKSSSKSSKASKSSKPKSGKEPKNANENANENENVSPRSSAFGSIAERVSAVQVERGIHVTVVGDKGCGKTSLVNSAAENEYLNGQSGCASFDGAAVVGPGGATLVLWDTASDDRYQRFRALCYAATDVVLLLFSLDDRDSFDHAESEWHLEIAELRADAPLLLAGTHADAEKRVVSKREVNELRASIEAHCYVEVDCNTPSTVQALLGAIEKIHKKSSRKKRKKQ
jgi:small GTP-binding protein